MDINMGLVVALAITVHERTLKRGGDRPEHNQVTARFLGPF